MLRTKSDKIAETLRSKGWSQRRLAKEMGVDIGNLSRVMRNKNQPSSSFVARMLYMFPERRFEDFFEVS